MNPTNLQPKEQIAFRKRIIEHLKNSEFKTEFTTITSLFDSEEGIFSSYINISSDVYDKAFQSNIDFINNERPPENADFKTLESSKKRPSITLKNNIGYLKDYFSTIGNSYKQAEYDILSQTHNISTDLYVDVPYFDRHYRGSVFIIVKTNEKSLFPVDKIEALSKEFSKLYRQYYEPLYEIPQFQRFANIFHDRIHAKLYHIEEMQAKFTISTHLLDRSADKIDAGIEELLYTGTSTQRKILENYSQEKFENRDKTKDKHWEYLSQQVIKEGVPEFDSLDMIDKFKRGVLSLKDIEIKTLASYFKELSNEYQEREYPIFIESGYFNKKQDFYIVIPIIAFGTIDGVAHIIFKPEDLPIFENKKAIKRIIKLFIEEYEGLLLDWDVAFENIEKQSKIKTKRLEYDTHYIEINPILRELKLAKYYKISKDYYDERLKISDYVPNLINKQKAELEKQHRNNAIITILIDSYAHNISTHSMTALSLWFRERGEYSHADESYRKLLKLKDEKYSKELKKYRLERKRFSDDSKNTPFVNHKKHINTPLSYELAPYYEFLFGKATFWNAITRTTNFLGQTFSIYDILWNDLVNNPLYLGTIANSEKVRQLHLKVTIIKKEEVSNNGFNNTKIIAKKDNQPLNAVLATIDFKNFYKKKNASLSIDDNDYNSVFIVKGEHHDILKEALSEFKAFFPGGIVGRHAFLTIIENEIRNVKHYKGDILKDIQENGLTLNVSIHRRNVNPNISDNKTPEIIKVGIWLEHSTTIQYDRMEKRMNDLSGDIVTQTKYRPKLGGTFQDKICAAMLLNNSFGAVQHQESKRDNIYYPWIKAALSLTNQTGNTEDFEISLRKYNENRNTFENIFSKRYESKSVFFKKYFHLWASADIFHATEINDSEWDNFRRYKFLYTTDANIHDYYKSKGIIRILEGEPNKDINTTYYSWLKIWLKDTKSFAYDFIEGNTCVGKLLWNGEDVIFYNKAEVEEIEVKNSSSEIHESEISETINIKIEHGGERSLEPDTGNYRSHGVLLREFCQSNNMANTITIEQLKSYELLETLATKICIFDDRIAERIKKEKVEQFYAPVLGLNIQSEDLVVWNSLKNNFTDYHFLIVHLSFIESMKSLDGIAYGESRIIEFLEEQIFQNYDLIKLKKNFKVIITTGRGRSEWWEKIHDNKYNRIVTFRPIESLLEAMEDALQIHDDIDLKYNLTNVLFGS